MQNQNRQNHLPGSLQSLQMYRASDKALYIAEQVFITFVLLWLLIALTRLNYWTDDLPYNLRDRFYFIGDKGKDFMACLLLTYLRRKTEMFIPWLSLTIFLKCRLLWQIAAAIWGLDPNEKTVMAGMFIVLTIAILIITHYPYLKKVKWQRLR